MPNSKKSSRDIRSKEPLCVLGNILAIIPPFYYLNKDKETRKKCWYRPYAIFLFLVLVTGNALAVWGRFRDAYSTFPASTLVITDLALNISLIATNVFTVLMPSFSQLENFKHFMEIFTKTDSFLNKGHSEEKIKKCKLFYFELILGHFILAAIFVYDGYVWTKGLGFAQYRHYIFRDFQGYHLFVTVMIMYNFGCGMNLRFHELNDVLQRILVLPNVNDESSEIYLQSEKCEFYKTVREVSQVYERQILQIGLFNSVFGLQILFITLSFMMGLLNALDIITVFIFTPNSFEKTVGGQLILLSCLCSMWQLILGVIVTVSCTRTSKEAQRTADICFSIRLRLPPIAETKQERALRDELTLLNQMAINQNTVFSAAGFFPIDYHLLLAIFGSVTSYVIVLIQFNK